MGNPIAHSQSPLIHQTFAQQTDQSLHYQAIQVDTDSFPQALDKFQHEGGKGLNITVPFKGNAWAAVDIATARAEQAEAVNTIWFAGDGRRHGDTTDGIGLVQDLLNHDVSLKHKRILLLGAGGAVRGVLASLLAEAPALIVLVNRTVARAEALVEQFSDPPGLQTCSFDALSGECFDIVINGTSASLKNELPPLPDKILNKNACCYDMVYASSDTIFVRWAKQQGASNSLDGLGMLIEQAAESFFIWRGIRPETKPVIDLLRSRV